MLKITRNDRKINSWMREDTVLEDVGWTEMIRKWRSAGHINRTRDNRWTDKMIDWYPRDK